MEEKQKIPPAIDNELCLLEELKDPEVAAAFLNAAIEEFLEDGDLKTFNSILHTLVKARTVKKIAQESEISRTHLYKIFDGKSKATFPSMIKLLYAAGFELTVKPSEKMS